MKIIIPTKGRANAIASKALRLFPDATLCVGDDEVDAYGRLSQNLLVHPAGVVGIGPIRQWVLDHVEDRCVVMVDDDVTHVYSQVGFHKRRIEDADAARATRDTLTGRRALLRARGMGGKGDTRGTGASSLCLRRHSFGTSARRKLAWTAACAARLLGVCSIGLCNPVRSR